MSCIDVPNNRAAADVRLLPPRADRIAAPGHVWNWPVLSSWRDSVWELLDDIVNDDVRRAFVGSPPKYVVCDDLSWLDEIILVVRGQQVDSAGLLTKRLRGRYRALRAVHGTRTSDLGSFYKKGLLPLDTQVIHAQARTIFLGGAFPELSNEDLQRAALAVGPELREGRLYFEANEDMFLQDCGHYMLYGSEYLTAIAAHLGRFRDYRQTLKAHGAPTVLVCDVPFALMREGTLREFAGIALEVVFQELLDGSSAFPELWRGGAFSVRNTVSPECIVGHYHPGVLRDPFRSTN